MSTPAPTLVSTLQDPAVFEDVIQDGVALIESEVARKTGLRAMALKAGFRTLKAIHPRVLHDVLAKLLPRFAPAVDPHFALACESGDVPAYFASHRGAIADALLSVTDERANHAQNRVILKTYQALRGSAKDHVEEALPGLAQMLVRHVR